MVSLLLCSSGSNARHEVSRGLLKGIVSAQKALQARDGEKGVAGRNGREEYFPDEGLIDLPSSQLNDFVEKENRKKRVSGLTCSSVSEKKLTNNGFVFQADGV